MSILRNKLRKQVTVFIREDYKFTNEDRIKYNELFAKFLKWEKNQNGTYETPFSWEDPNCNGFCGERNDFSIEAMKFTDNMDWINLVVDRLESLNMFSIHYRISRNLSDAPKQRSLEAYIHTTSNIQPHIRIVGGTMIQSFYELCYHIIDTLIKDNIYINSIKYPY